LVNEVKAGCFFYRWQLKLCDLLITYIGVLLLWGYEEVQYQVSSTSAFTFIIFLQEKDIYLLDDPLAAVDVHVARHLYSECIVGLLRYTTRILITHHVQFLHAADFVIVVEGGQIRQICRYFV